MGSLAMYRLNLSISERGNLSFATEHRVGNRWLHVLWYDTKLGFHLMDIGTGHLPTQLVRAHQFHGRAAHAAAIWQRVAPHV